VTDTPVRKPGRPANEAIRCQRQEEILDAAVQLFAEHGYSETATQALADLLQVGKGTLYRYFPTKRELFLAAVDRIMRKLQQAIDAALADVDEPFERIHAAVRCYLRFFAEHPEYVELLIQERAQFKDRIKPTYFVHRDARIGRWHDLFRTLIEAGRVRPVEVEKVTDAIGDMIYGTMFTNYFARRTQSPEQQAHDILDIALNGLLSESERKSRRPVSTSAGAKPSGDRP